MEMEVEMEIDVERNGWNLSLKKKYKEYKKENCGYALLPLCHGFLLIYIHIKRAKSYKAPEMKNEKPPSRKEGGEAEDEQPRPGTTQNNRSKGKENEG